MIFPTFFNLSLIYKKQRHYFATEVHLVKALVFPVVMYGCESWTEKKADQMVNTEIRLIIFFAAKDGEAPYSQQKQDWELTVAQIMNSLLPNSDLN